MHMILKEEDMMLEISLDFLEATVEYALRKEELRDGFIEYLKTII